MRNRHFLLTCTALIMAAALVGCGAKTETVPTPQEDVAEAVETVVQEQESMEDAETTTVDEEPEEPEITMKATIIDSGNLRAMSTDGDWIRVYDSETKKYGIVDKQFQEIVPCEYSDIRFINGDKYQIYLEKEGNKSRWFMNKETNEIIEVDFAKYKDYWLGGFNSNMLTLFGIDKEGFLTEAVFDAEKDFELFCDTNQATDDDDAIISITPFDIKGRAGINTNKYSQIAAYKPTCIDKTGNRFPLLEKNLVTAYEDFCINDDGWFLAYGNIIANIDTQEKIEYAGGIDIITEHIDDANISVIINNNAVFVRDYIDYEKYSTDVCEIPARILSLETGDYINEKRYASLSSSEFERYLFQDIEGRGWGYLDQDFNEMKMYKDATEFGNGYAAVLNDDNSVDIIDTDLNVVELSIVEDATSVTRIYSKNSEYAYFRVIKSDGSHVNILYEQE